MTKHTPNITSLAQLEQAERKVRTRIKQQEAELLQRVKKLPEELVTTAIVRLVSSVLKGATLKSIVNLAKRVGKNVVSNVFKDSI